MSLDLFCGSGSFAPSLVNCLDQRLRSLLSNETSRRPPVLTDINLLATFLAVGDVILTNPPYNSWPSNQVPVIELSADKRTEWFRETLQQNGITNFAIGPCHGQPLDLQIRQGEHVLVNLESELGGNRQRAEDMAKLTGHRSQPLASIMIVREKSFRRITDTMNKLNSTASRRVEPFINIVIYWPHGTRISSASPFISISEKRYFFTNIQKTMRSSSSKYQSVGTNFRPFLYPPGDFSRTISTIACKFSGFETEHPQTTM